MSLSLESSRSRFWWQSQLLPSQHSPLGNKEDACLPKAHLALKKSDLPKLQHDIVWCLFDQFTDSDMRPTKQLITGFCTSQLVQEFSQQQYHIISYFQVLRLILPAASKVYPSAFRRKAAQFTALPAENGTKSLATCSHLSTRNKMSASLNCSVFPPVANAYTFPETWFKRSKMACFSCHISGMAAISGCIRISSSTTGWIRPAKVKTYRFQVTKRVGWPWACPSDVFLSGAAMASIGQAQGLAPKEHSVSICKWQSQMGLMLSASLKHATGSCCCPHQDVWALLKLGFNTQLSRSPRLRLLDPRSMALSAGAWASASTWTWAMDNTDATRIISRKKA